MALTLWVGLLLMKARLLNLICVATSLFYSEISLGCAVCGFGEEETREAFILTTGIMTVVPLAAIGSIVYYVYRRMSQNSKDVRKNL